MLGRMNLRPIFLFIFKDMQRVRFARLFATTGNAVRIIVDGNLCVLQILICLVPSEYYYLVRWRCAELELPRAVAGGNTLRSERTELERTDRSAAVSTLKLRSKALSYPETGLVPRLRALSAITSIFHEMCVAILPLLIHEINLSTVIFTRLRVP